jgi:hypothetical protein
VFAWADCALEARGKIDSAVHVHGIVLHEQLGALS